MESKYMQKEEAPKKNEEEQSLESSFFRFMEAT